MKPLAIVNPSAGGGRAGRTFSALRAVMERRIGGLDVALSEAPGHAIELSKAATRAGRRLVIAVGGDGTLHEVANGVLEAGGNASVAYVGQGTGGDFRRMLGIDHRLDRYLDAIVEGQDCLVDVGKVNYLDHAGRPSSRWFLNILSAGMSGLVDRNVATTTRVFGGKAAYFLASLRALSECRRAPIRCETRRDASFEVRRFPTYLLAICNGAYFGGGMRIAPMARPDDGRFEVVSMDAPSRAAFAAYSRRIYGGGHLDLPDVRHFACDRIRVDVDEERVRSSFLLDVDGEALGRLPIEVELVPRALRVRAPFVRDGSS